MFNIFKRVKSLEEDVYKLTQAIQANFYEMGQVKDELIEIGKELDKKANN